MDLPEYAGILRRRWVWVLLPLVLAAGGAAVWAELSPRSYASTEVLFYLSPTPDSVAPEVRLNSYVSLATSTQLIDEIRQGLRLAEPTAEVARRITAAAKPNSLIITLTATGSTPEEARRLALVASQRLLSLSNTLGVAGTPNSAFVPGGKAGRAGSAQQMPTGYLVPVQSAGPGVEQTIMPSAVGLGVILGLLLGVVVALAREATDGTIRSPDQLARLGLGEHATVHVPDLTHAASPDQVPAGFRLLHTVLLHAGALPAGIVVCSCSPRDRRRYVSTALAVTLARTSAETVLVSTDLDETRLPGPDGTLDEPGLGEVLIKRATSASVTRNSGEPHLSLLPCGQLRSVPEGLLASSDMAEVIADLRARFDAVVIDAAALEARTSTLGLARVTGAAVVLVVVQGLSRRREVHQALQLVQAAGVPVAAVALVSVSRRRAAPAPSGDPVTGPPVDRPRPVAP